LPDVAWTADEMEPNELDRLAGATNFGIAGSQLANYFAADALDSAKCDIRLFNRANFNISLFKGQPSAHWGC
jgi:hypothetical protein